MKLQPVADSDVTICWTPVDVSGRESARLALVVVGGGSPTRMSMQASYFKCY